MKKRQIIGIINCTPDSYFARGRFTQPDEAIQYGLNLLEQGVDLLDIGGESTRPGSNVAVGFEEEKRRVLPVIRGIRAASNIPLSIDTFKPEVAEAAIAEGANMINDITGFSNPNMRLIAKKSGAQCCLMHMYGSPHSLPNPSYPLGIIEEMLLFFKKRIRILLDSGIESTQIIIDPGIGGGAFGKSPDQSLQILKHLHRFVDLGYPVLVGLSRKSFLQKILQKPASELLSTTLALNTMALLEGAAYIRVHDVAEHRDILAILERLEAVN
jgi:dihydropteroate synthase